jgi:spermidine/putrescine transport system permease protein
MRMTLDRSHLALPVVVLLGAGAVLPIIMLAVLSVLTVEDFELIPALTLESWREIASKPTYVVLIAKAVGSGLVTAILAAVCGYPVALALTRLRKAWKGLALIVLLTPLYTGEIVRIYAWRIVLGNEGLINAALQGVGLIDAPLKFILFSPFSTHLVLLYDTLPLMILAIWVAAEFVDPAHIEAARDLGARPFEAFWRVVLPLTASGLAGGTCIVFALAAGDMLTPSLLGGTSGATAMAMIDELFGTAFDWPLASALALALLATLTVVATVLVVLVLRLGRRGESLAKGFQPKSVSWVSR